MKCPMCYSFRVRLAGSYPNREAVDVHCEDCGRTMAIDVENPEVAEPEAPVVLASMSLDDPAWWTPLI